jgi:hypothetical protein
MTNTTTEVTSDMLWDMNFATGEDIKFISYSGRAMYGKTCFGVVLPCAEDAVLWALNLSAEEFAPILSNPRIDSMGRNIVVYFPNLSISDETLAEWSDDEVPL